VTQITYSENLTSSLLIGQSTLRRRIKLGTFAALDQTDRAALRDDRGFKPPRNQELPQPPPQARRPRRHAVLRRRRRAESTKSTEGSPAQSTTSPSNPSSQRSPPTRPLSTSPQQEQPSQKSRQNDHHRDPMNTKAPPETTGRPSLQSNPSSPTATPPSSTDATGNTALSSLEPAFRRCHSSLYKALARDRLDQSAMRDLLVEHRPVNWPAVFAMDASSWPPATPRPARSAGSTTTPPATAPGSPSCATPRCCPRRPGPDRRGPADPPPPKRSASAGLAGGRLDGYRPPRSVSLLHAVATAARRVLGARVIPCRAFGDGDLAAASSLRPPQVVTKRPCEQGLFFASYRRKCVEVVID